MDLSPFLNLLPQLPFMPLAAIILSLIAITFWDSLAKPYGLEQQRWICAVVLFVASVIGLAQVFHLLWESVKPLIEDAKLWRRRKVRLGRMCNGERMFLKRFMESNLLYFKLPSRETWLQTLSDDKFIRPVANDPDGHTSFQIDHDLKEFLEKNPQYLERLPEPKKKAKT